MAITDQNLLTGLSAAYTRKQQGSANPTDLANLEYAQTQGWTPPQTSDPLAPPTVNKTQEIPGIGTLTTVPKQITTQAGPPSPPGYDYYGNPTNTGGMVERAGLPLVPQATPPAGATLISGPSGLQGLTEAQIWRDPNSNNIYKLSTTSAPAPSSPVAPLPTLPTLTDPLPEYQNPGADQASQYKQMFEAIDTELKNYAELIRQGYTPTEEEKALALEFQTARENLRTFDTETLARTESMIGTGRGRTTAFVSQQQDKERRMRALERLGLSQDAETLSERLSGAKEDRKGLLEQVGSLFDLSAKRFDAAMGLTKELASIDKQQRDDARAYLVDVVDWAQGLTWDELDPETQAQVTASVANSPLTLGMLKQALKTGAQTGQAEAPKTLDTAQGPLQWNPSTGSWEPVTVGGVPVGAGGMEGNKPTMIDGKPYNLVNGQYVPVPIEGQESDLAVETLQGKVDLIDELLNSGGLAGSVGAYGIARWTPFTADQADRQNFAAGVMQLINKETLDTLLALKQQGGTLGALSDGEKVLLQSAATKIGSWIHLDWNGNPTGKFAISEEFFKKELGKIRKVTGDALNRARGFSVSPDKVSLVKSYIQDEQKLGTSNKVIYDSLVENGLYTPPTNMTEDPKIILDSLLKKANAQTGGEIKPVAIGGKIVTVSTEIASSLQKADAELFAATGQHLQINQAYRTSAQQAELYRRSQAGEIGRAAPPGHSWHERGLAVDISNWREAEPFLRKYGLRNELSDDKGHFSYGEFRV